MKVLCTTWKGSISTDWVIGKGFDAGDHLFPGPAKRADFESLRQKEGEEMKGHSRVEKWQVRLPLCVQETVWQGWVEHLENFSPFKLAMTSLFSHNS